MPPPPPPLVLSEVLPAHAVLLDLAAKDKSRAIACASASLAKSAHLSAEAIETALLAREALGSTGVGGGIGLPHARIHTLRETHAVFLRLASPIAYESTDDQPVDLVCAIVAPDEPNSALLTAVSALSKVLRDPAQRERLRKTQSAAEARTLLTAA